jgi:hypothetical protein
MAKPTKALYEIIDPKVFRPKVLADNQDVHLNPAYGKTAPRVGKRRFH